MKHAFLIDPPSTQLPSGTAFLRHARYLLREDYMVKIRRVLAELTDEQIWWRPNEDSNSIANLMLHLCGNARQWISAGVGGAPDARNRPQEFASRERISREELVARLEGVLSEVDVVLEGLEQDLRRTQSDAPLQRICTPQRFEQTVLDAVFHVVEHFSYHTGQIVLLAKWHTGDRIRLYNDSSL